MVTAVSVVTPHIARGRRLVLVLFIVSTVITLPALAGLTIYAVAT